jgi:hypothetical protein
LCLAAVKEDGRALCYAPEAMKTEELCIAAARRSGRALQYAPSALRGRVMAAVENNQDVKG